MSTSKNIAVDNPKPKRRPAGPARWRPAERRRMLQDGKRELAVIDKSLAQLARLQAALEVDTERLHFQRMMCSGVLQILSHS